jgi:hypothetical protein
MLRRMVLSDCRTMPWLERGTIFELLDIRTRQTKRRLNFKTLDPAQSIWRCRGMQAWFPSGVTLLHFRDEQEVKYNFSRAQLHSGHLLL